MVQKEIGLPTHLHCWNTISRSISLVERSVKRGGQAEENQAKVSENYQLRTPSLYLFLLLLLSREWR